MKCYQGTGTSRVRRIGVWEHLPISRWVERRKWGNRQCYVTLPAHIRKVSMSQVSHGHVMEKERKVVKNHNITPFSNSLLPRNDLIIQLQGHWGPSRNLPRTSCHQLDRRGSGWLGGQSPNSCSSKTRRGMTPGHGIRPHKSHRGPVG